MKTVSFKTWIEKFKSDDSPIGDLAHDIYFDQRFPSSSCDKDEILDYLKSRGAIPQAIRAFEKAWIAYLNSR